MAIDDAEYIAIAIVAALQRDGGVGAPVYDRVPDNEPPPAVILDSVDIQGSTTKDGCAIPFSFRIVTIIRGRSKQQARKIMSNISERLEKRPLIVSGFRVSNPELVSAPLQSEDDMLTHVGNHYFNSIIL